MLRLLLRLGVLGIALCCAVAPASAQGPEPRPGEPRPGDEPRIRLVADETPLAEVLRQLASQAGIDVVFAERTVEGRTVSGRYVGDDPEGALRTALRGSGLRAERVRPRQYVIVPEAPAPLYDDDPFPAARATLSGTVVDGETGEVLPGAHVVLAGLDLGAVTNAAGYFALPGLPAGMYRVRASFVGYRAVELDLPVYPGGGFERPVLRLFPQPIASAPVVVEGRDGERRDLEVVPGTATVGVRQASALPALLGEGDLISALEWLPGVTRAGEAGGELVVRGAESQYNRYLLDGAPVIHPWHAFGLFSVFQPEALKTVRLHKGSFPAEYGSALSAVLDLEMRDGERQRPSGIVALSPISLRAVVEAPAGRNLSLMVSARRTWLDLLLEPQLRLGAAGGLPAIGFDPPRLPGGGEEERQEVGYFFYDVSTKLTWRIADGHRLSLSVYEGGDRLSAAAPFTTLGGTPQSSYSEAAPEDPLALDLGYTWGNRLISTRYRGLLGRSVFVTATGYVSRYAATEEVTARPTAASSITSDYRVRFTEGGLRLDADYYHSLEHQVRAGLRLVGRDFTGTLSEEQRRSERLVEWRDERETVRVLEVVAYVQDTWQPAAGWQFQPGLRLEVFGLGPHVSLNPRFHLRHTLRRDRLFLRAGVGRQTQPIHRLRDRYAFTYDLASDRWLPASDRVRPASAWQAASGVEWVPRTGLALGVEAFARRLADVLLPLDPYQEKNGLDGPGIAPGALLDQYVPGAGRAGGIEASAEAERGRWRTGLSYTLSRTQERVPGEPYRPARYDAPHQLEGFLLGGSGPWTLSLTALLRSGYPVTVPTARYDLGDPLDPDETDYLHRPALYNGRLPAYARVDLSVAYAFRVAGLDFDAQAQAYNLLNRRNTVGQRFAPDAGSVATPVPGLPILPMVGLRARW
jgi:hypothetical protein